MKKIYLIRHGQTDYNVLGVLQGSGVDTTLNEKGRQQSMAFFRRYSHIPFKKMYVSCLSRTLATVQPFIVAGVPYEQLPGLNEMSYGTFDGKNASRGEETAYRKMVRQWNAGNTHLKFPGGESPEEVRERQKTAIHTILSSPEEDIILIAMHGRAMRIFLTQLLDLPLTEMEQFPHSNLCLYLLHYNDSYFCLEKSNDLAHLDLILSSDTEKKEIV